MQVQCSQLLYKIISLCFSKTCVFQGHLDTDGSLCDHGSLLISTTYFERKTIAKFQMETKNGNGTDSDVGFCIGFGPEGPWESFRSFLPLSVVPKSLKENFIALEVVMKNGKKYAILRGLATVVNDSDVKVDICVCSVSQLHSRTFSNSESSRKNVVVEEVFENQRYQPISGWGSKWPGFRGSDTERWSTRDFSYSSKVGVTADTYITYTEMYTRILFLSCILVGFL